MSKTPHSDMELGEAYQIGYEAGQKAKSPDETHRGHDADTHGAGMAPHF